MFSKRTPFVVWLLLFSWTGDAGAVAVLEAPLAMTRLAEIAHETRPVIAQEDRFQVAPGIWEIPGVQVPVASSLLASFGLPMAEGPWELRVSLRDAQGAILFAESRTVATAGWQDFRLPLPSLAGALVTIRMAARGKVAAPHAGQPKMVLGVPRFLRRAPSPTAGKNVLLVSLDTLRADRMSAYGAKRPTTPRMAALAAKGARFGSARAPASSTPPSHMTMLTGASPCTHGVWGVHVEDQPPENLESLAQILGREGYSTRAVTENAFVGAPWGFARGFDSFLEFKGTPRSDGRIAAPTGLGPQTFAAARRALRSVADRRFFLFVHTYQVHAPREPAEPYASLYPATESPGLTTEQQPAAHNPADHDLRRYDQLVRQLDDLVGGLLDELDALGLREETLVVLTSDHGEAFFEHDVSGHGFWVWEEVLRIPLILAGPGVPPGVRPDEVVGLQDLVPTILDLVGQPSPAGLDGRSLRRLLNGDTLPERFHYAETAPGGVRALSSKRFKIHRRGARVRDIAFDLAKDPRETVPIPLAEWAELPLAEAADLLRLRGVLDDWAAKCDQQREMAAAKRIKQAGVDPLRREKLRALGYID